MRKTVVKSFNNQSVTGSNTYYSQTVVLDELKEVGFQYAFVGTMEGTITLQISIDGENFKDIEDDFFTPELLNPAGSDTSHIAICDLYGAKFARLKYVNTSGSGTLNAFFNAKGGV